MSLQTILHAARTAGQDARRNPRLTFLTVLLILIAFIVVDVIFFISLVTDASLAALEERFDMVVYFQPDASEEGIANAADELRALSSITALEVVSAEQARRRFAERHAGDTALVDALQLFENSPLGARFVIRLASPDAFRNVQDRIQSSTFAPLLRDTVFADTAAVLEHVRALGAKIRVGATVLLVFFSVVALVTVYSVVAMRVAAQRETIAVMEIVGATRKFIELPFLFLSVGFVIAATSVHVLVIGGVSLAFGGELYAFFNGLPEHPVAGFIDAFFILILWQFFVATALILVSTRFAIRRST